MKPNRIAVYLTATAGLLGAIAIPVGNLDTTSTVGVLGGLTAIVTTAVTYLVGWQKHEERQSTADVDQLPHVDTAATIVADAGDKGSA